MGLFLFQMGSANSQLWTEAWKKYGRPQNVWESSKPEVKYLKLELASFWGKVRMSKWLARERKLGGQSKWSLIGAVKTSYLIPSVVGRTLGWPPRIPQLLGTQQSPDSSHSIRFYHMVWLTLEMRGCPSELDLVTWIFFKILFLLEYGWLTVLC